MEFIIRDNGIDLLIAYTFILQIRTLPISEPIQVTAKLYLGISLLVNL